MVQSKIEITEEELQLNPSLGHKPETLTKIFVRKFLKNKLAVIGLIVLMVIIFSAIFARFLTPYDYQVIDLTNALAPPSADNWMGTDRYGRDILTRVLYGGQVSLLVGFGSVTGALLIGVTVGASAGYFGGIIDNILMRIVDVIISIPTFFLLITLVTIFSPSMWMLILIFSITGWMGMARLIRGEFLSLRSREFVLASRTIGTSNARIIFSHILPNTLGPIIVAATLSIGGVILSEAALSYLGLGINPPTPSWGNILEDAQNYTVLKTAPWYPFFPGLMILLTVLCFNFVGDGLRDALDPKAIE
jgi:peptide/nickel transport system permease protein